MFIKLEISEAALMAVKSLFSKEFEEDYYTRYPGRATLPERAGHEFEDAVGVFEDADGHTVLRCGYFVTPAAARYTTSRGNTWGVVKTPHGECYAVFIGRRSRVRDLEAMLKAAGIGDPRNLRVAEYRTEGPIGMKWWQTRGEYLLALDDISLAAYIVANKSNMSRMVQPPEWWLDVVCGLTPERETRITKMVAIDQKTEAAKYRRKSAMGL